VPVSALILALAAAFLHALWNMLAARSKDSQATLALAMTIGPALLLPFALVRWQVEPAAYPWMALSAALELVYLVLLGAAYHRADMSLIYPIARGLAPVLVLIGGTILFHERITPVSTLGIVIVAVGVLMVRGVRSPGELRHVALACTIAAVIASYTLVDQQGVRLSDPITYLVVVTGVPGLILLVAILWRDGTARIRAALSPSLGVASVAGVSAYGFVLAALTIAPAALVSAVRETSVVIGTALAALVLHEPVERSRWVGAAVVTLGVGLVVLG
jgi:drug/metabolite transporter (DMT)-like permease